MSPVFSGKFWSVSEGYLTFQRFIEKIIKVGLNMFRSANRRKNEPNGNIL